MKRRLREHWRLAALAGIAAVLCTWLAIDIAGDSSPPSPRVFPELSGDNAAAIERIEIRRDQGSVVLARTPDGFSLEEPVRAVADADGVRALLGALEVLTIERRLPPEPQSAIVRGLAAPDAVIRVSLASGKRVELAIGAKAAAGTAVWAQRQDSDEVYLIDAYAAREITVDGDALRPHDPLPLPARSADRIEIALGGKTFLATGSPWRVRSYGGAFVRLAPAAREKLFDALDDLRFAAFPDTPIGPPTSEIGVAMWIAVGGSMYRITDLEPCPGNETLRLVESNVGFGCVAKESLSVLASFLDSGDAIYDRLLVASGQKVVSAEIDLLGRHYSLERSGGDTFVRRGDDAYPADPGTIRATLASLATAAAGSIIPASDISTAKTLGHVRITYAGGGKDTLTFARVGTRSFVRRNDEPVWIAVAPDTAEKLSPPAITYRSRQIISEDPTALRAADKRIASRTVERIEMGDLVGHFEATLPEGAEVLQTSTQALAQLADLRATRWVTDTASSRHGLANPRADILLTFAPPPIPGETGHSYRVFVGNRTRQGCYAKRADTPAVFELSRDACQSLLRSWTTPR